MPEVIALDDLRLSPTACRFEGGDRIPVSMFVTAYPERGQGPDLHLHPYPETFVVQEGVGEWTAGEETTVVEAGNVVVVPAGKPHGFKNAGDTMLRVVSVHPNPHVIQEDL